MPSHVVTIIHPDGSEQTANVHSDIALAEMQKLVNGYIEVLALADGRVMVVNEDGLLLKLPVNAKATELFGASRRGAEQRKAGEKWVDCVVGTVVVCAGELLA